MGSLYQPFQAVFEIWQVPLFQVMFPDPNHVPSQRPEFGVDAPIPRAIISDFLAPEIGACRRLGIVDGTAVPKTAIHEDHRAAAPEGEIRSTG